MATVNTQVTNYIDASFERLHEIALIINQKCENGESIDCEVTIINGIYASVNYLQTSPCELSDDEKFEVMSFNRSKYLIDLLPVQTFDQTFLSNSQLVITSGTGGSGGSGGSGEACTFTGVSTVNEGGVSIGDVFINADCQEVFGALLTPFIPPVFSSFNLSGFNILEVGDIIPSGLQTFTWATSLPLNVQTNSIDILDITGAATLASGLADDGAEAVTIPSNIQKVTAVSNVFRVTGIDTQANSFQRDDTVFWRWRWFYGKDINAGPLVEAEIEALPNTALDTGFAGNYSFPVGAGYLHFAFPQAWGTPATFKDQSTNLDVAMEVVYTVALTNSFGIVETYNVYRSTNILNGEITVIVA